MMINHLIKMHAHQTIQTIYYEWEKNLKTELWKCGIKQKQENYGYVITHKIKLYIFLSVILFLL